MPVVGCLSPTKQRSGVLTNETRQQPNATKVRKISSREVDLFIVSTDTVKPSFSRYTYLRKDGGTSTVPTDFTGIPGANNA